MNDKQQLAAMGEHAREMGNCVEDDAFRHLSRGQMSDMIIILENICQKSAFARFRIGDRVRKTKGSRWQGNVVGTYSTSMTPEGYAVESETEHGSVQIYPVSALELVK